MPATTVKEYFSILEDTLIGAFLWPWDRSERKKSRPKFFFFDPGVARGLQRRLNDPPTNHEIGFLFEAWFYFELKKINAYFRKRLRIDLWRSGDWEIDFLIRNAKNEGIAIEVKSGVVDDISESALKKFRKEFPNVEVVIASRLDTESRVMPSGTMVLPWKVALERVKHRGSNPVFSL